MNRIAILLGGMLTVSTANAQVTESSILDSLQLLRKQSNLFIRITGDDITQGRSTPFTTDVYWSAEDNATVVDKVDVEEYRYSTFTQKQELIKRTVADGEILHTYNLLTHEFSETPYSRFDGKTNLTYRRDLLLLLQSDVSGHGTNAVRLLDEIYGGLLAVHRDWLPGSDLVVNPMSLTYRAPTVDHKSLTYQFVSDKGLLELKFITFRSFTTQAPTHVTQWFLTMLAVNPNPLNFEPYQPNTLLGWRSIIAPRPLSN